MIRRVVIIGAGQAGGEAALHLRKLGFAGEVTLVGEESLAPYQRPLLSKAYLRGETDRDGLLLRASAAYAEDKIALVLSRRALLIDRRLRRVQIERGRELGYDALILATGARARQPDIPGASLSGVYRLRTADDADALRAALESRRRLVVIGAGYVGLEVAAIARTLGVETDIIEAGPRPLPHAGPAVAGFLLQRHVAAGVRFHLSTNVVAIIGEAAVEAVVLEDGLRLPADCVVIGLGAEPDVELARKAGLVFADGVRVNAAMQTSDPSIYAIGDCALRPSGRQETVHSAIETAHLAAAAITGIALPAPSAPTSWSEQYGLIWRTAGRRESADRLRLRGRPETGSFAVFHLKGRRLVAVDTIGRAAEFSGAKTLIERGADIAPDLLFDDKRPFKTVVDAALGLEPGPPAR